MLPGCQHLQNTVLAKFVKDFDTNSNAIIAANDSLTAIRASIAKDKQMPEMIFQKYRHKSYFSSEQSAKATGSVLWNVSAIQMRH